MKEFKAFILRGNVVDLAVGVVMGVAFQAVVNSLVKDVFTPFLGLFGTPDFAQVVVRAGRATIRLGLFLNAVISFVMIAVSVFFFVVRPLSRLMEGQRTEKPVAAPVRECPQCLSSIPAKATRCAFCTGDVEVVGEG